MTGAAPGAVGYATRVPLRAPLDSRTGHGSRTPFNAIDVHNMPRIVRIVTTRPSFPRRECYARSVDRLRAHDLEAARETAPSEKARQALEAMRFGIELKRVALRARSPGADEDEIDRLLRAWLADD